MTATGWSYVSATAFCAVFGLALALHLLGRRPGSRVPSLGTAIGWVMVTPTGRVVTLLFWCWVGLHFFAR